jgi:hypothetical protein
MVFGIFPPFSPIEARRTKQVADRSVLFWNDESPPLALPCPCDQSVMADSMAERRQWQTVIRGTLSSESHVKEFINNTFFANERLRGFRYIFSVVADYITLTRPDPNRCQRDHRRFHCSGLVGPRKIDT